MSTDHGERCAARCCTSISYCALTARRERRQAVPALDTRIIIMHVYVTPGNNSARARAGQCYTHLTRCEGCVGRHCRASAGAERSGD
jgi:hypothetical protein